MQEAAEQRRAEAEAIAIRRETIMATLLAPLVGATQSFTREGIEEYVSGARNFADLIMEAARE